MVFLIFFFPLSTGLLLQLLPLLCV